MELADVTQLCAWENDSEDWWMGASCQPVSVEAMTQFVHGSTTTCTATVNADGCSTKKRQRVGEWTTVGAVDLYDFDPVRSCRCGCAR